MIRKRTILSLALLATTAACGGGGGGGAPGPAPAVSGGAPAPTASGSTNFNNPSVMATTDANGNLTATIAADATSQTATLTQGDGTADNPTTIHITGPNWIDHTFNTSANQLSLEDVTFNGVPIFNTNGSSLAMYSENGGKDVLVSDNSGQLSFSNYGVWSHTDADGHVTVGAFATGNETPVANIPTTGGATYQGSAVGTGSTGGQAFNLAGSFTGNVDFGARTAAVNLNMNAIAADGGQTAFNLASGPISMTGGRYSGAIAGSGVSGTTAGALYGTAAQEMAGVFSVAGGGTTAIGAYGGAQQH
jgi:hypothetical protein